MTTKEAASIIREMTDALEANPSQFHIEVSVAQVAQSISVVNATGPTFNVTGGGPGSSTIGNQVTARGGRVEISITPKMGHEAMAAQMSALVETMRTIASELEQPAPQKGKLERLYETMLASWVPPVISAAVGALVKIVLP